jgi:hypothetical protein
VIKQMGCQLSAWKINSQAKPKADVMDFTSNTRAASHSAVFAVFVMMAVQAVITATAPL